MKKLLPTLLLFITVAGVNAQTLIATSSHPQATANQNQRKIVRDASDNVYIVYQDIVSQQNVIKGVYFKRNTGVWSTPAVIANGQNPTLCISKTGLMHLLYETNDSLKRIIHRTTTDFLTWTPDQLLSDTLFRCSLPVADVDSAGTLNAFWIQNNDTTSQSLIYCSVTGGIPDSRTMMTQNEISNIAVACNLLYAVNDLFFAVNFDQDSISLFKRVSTNIFEKITTVQGTQPCLTANSYDTTWTSYIWHVRLLYIEELWESLNELSMTEYQSYPFETTLESHTDYVCVDDLAPSIGYSYLHKENQTVYHSFTFGGGWSEPSILDEIPNDPLFPSIAYKTFNISYVDYIWMMQNPGSYDIYYKRDDKILWFGATDDKSEKGFKITGNPNPFSKEITISIEISENTAAIPIIEIYNTTVHRVTVLKNPDVSQGTYTYRWNGTDDDGTRLPDGLYVVKFTVGNKKTARKVLLESER